jgi:cell division protein FtsI (penicillin-binding protein 3)
MTPREQPPRSRRATPSRSTAQRNTAQRSTTERSTTPRSTTPRSSTQRSTAQRSADRRASQPRSATARAGTARTNTARTNTAQTNTARTGTARTSTTRTGTARTGTARTGTARTGTARTGTARTGTARTGNRATASRPTRRPARQRRAAPPRRRVRKRRGLPLANQRRRLRATFAVITVLLVVLAGRLVQLQGLDASAYAAEGQSQRLRKVSLPAQRGQIVDRNGVALAIEQEARTVFADPKLVKDADANAAKLAPVIDRPVAELAQLMRKKSRFVVLAKTVDVAVARQVSELDLPGIGSLPRARRVYPNGALAASVVGFVGEEGAGLGGIEYALNSTLTGTDGEMVVERDTKGRVIPAAERHVRRPVTGSSVQLTIDRDIQWMAQQTLAGAVRRYRAQGGHIIVLDVRTGEVLALASAPTFDPNQPAAAAAGALSNGALSNVYEPGSVNKVITAAAALDTGLLTPDSTVVVPPKIKVADKTFRELHHSRTRELTFRGVLAKSSNVGTISIAQRMGKHTIYDYLRRFGLGAKTGIGLPGESAGLLPPADKWSGSQVGNVPIGHGVSGTALQMAEVYATVANGGIRVAPRLVMGTRDAEGRLTPPPASQRTRVVSAKTARQLTGMLEHVIGPGGTAPTAAIDGYRVAGKTGTARRVGANGRYETGKYISSFIGFAPADAPQLVVEVVLDRPAAGYYAGTVATPAFRDVMSFALAARRVPPTGRPAPRGKLSPDESR